MPPSTASAAAVRLPLVRLPAVLFPLQAVTLSTVRAPISQELCSLAWRCHEGRVAALGPVGRVAVELKFLYDSHVLDSEFPTPAGVAHAVVGERVRLVKVCNEAPGQSADVSAVAAAGWPISAFDLVCDVPMVSEARAEKVGDEAARALHLLDQGIESGAFGLEPSHLDEELGMQPSCDPRCHPLWSLSADPPQPPAELSFWLAARLPLSTSLRAAVLAETCPLKRLHDVSDAMRLLLSSDASRFRHRLRLSFDAPASVGCSTLSSGQLPRRVVVEAPPVYSWSAEDSFPHG
jgi:hypothetical protein